MNQFLLLEGKKWTATKEPLDEMKDESEKLTWNIQKLRPWHLVPSLHGK